MAESAIEEIGDDKKLAKLDKAAILLLSLGKDSAAKVLKHLNPREVQHIGSAMTSVENVSHGDIHSVMEAFLDELGEDALGVDPSEYAQSLMADALGDGGGHLMDAALLGDQVKGLEALKWQHPSTISNMLRNEHPQVVAIVLSYFDSDETFSGYAFSTFIFKNLRGNRGIPIKEKIEEMEKHYNQKGIYSWSEV
jgi:flagellar motor switch protein FliG